MIPRLVSLLALFALVSPAQLTTDQRIADFRNMADLYARRYAAIDCPVLMLVGALSPEHPMQDASRALAQVLPDVRVETIPGHAHLAMRDAPEFVAHVIAGFLED